VAPNGERSGRATITDDGRRVGAALEADGHVLEDTFLDVLNGRR
jgi:hypothetical protein